MKTKMKALFALCTLGVALTGATGTAFADGWDRLGNPLPTYSVTVENHSGYSIRYLYMGVDDYGKRDDVLGNSILNSGYQTTIRARQGIYDVELIDQDGDHCVVNNVSITTNRDLILTQDMLLRCEGHR